MLIVCQAVHQPIIYENEAVPSLKSCCPLCFTITENEKLRKAPQELRALLGTMKLSLQDVTRKLEDYRKQLGGEVNDEIQF